MIVARAVENWYEAITYSVAIIAIAAIIIVWTVFDRTPPWK